jgi:hypothetical protein
VRRWHRRRSEVWPGRPPVPLRPNGQSTSGSPARSRRCRPSQREPSTTYVNEADGSFRWIAVFLTQKARDAYDFGYKGIEESMGPVEASCPKRIIAAASTLRHPDPSDERNYAARWRQKCLDQATAKTKRKAELVHGATIRLSRTLDFTDGHKDDRFVVEIVKWHGRNRTYFRASNGGLYRIRNLDKIGYRVEAVAV